MQRLIRAQTSRVIRVKNIIGESILLPVEIIQAAAVRADPDIAIAVFAKGVDIIIVEIPTGKFFLISSGFFAERGGKDDAAPVGACPEIAFPVLEQGRSRPF